MTRLKDAGLVTLRESLVNEAKKRQPAIVRITTQKLDAHPTFYPLWRAGARPMEPLKLVPPATTKPLIPGYSTRRRSVRIIAQLVD